MPRLIHLNGPPGIGKSTVARMYADAHPSVLNLDVDVVRSLLGGWREDFLAAGELVRPLALAMARTHLGAGNDVVLPQFLGRLSEVERFEAAATSAGAAFVEVVLMDARPAAVERFAARAHDDSDPWHRTVVALVEEAGGTVALESMYDSVLGVVEARPSAVVVRSAEGDPASTYAAVVDALGPAGG